MRDIEKILVLKAAFHLRVFHTCVYARKSLNLSKFYITIKYLNKYTLKTSTSRQFQKINDKTESKKWHLEKSKIWIKTREYKHEFVIFRLYYKIIIRLTDFVIKSKYHKLVFIFSCFNPYLGFLKMLFFGLCFVI